MSVIHLQARVSADGTGAGCRPGGTSVGAATLPARPRRRSSAGAGSVSRRVGVIRANIISITSSDSTCLGLALAFGVPMDAAIGNVGGSKCAAARFAASAARAEAR